MSAPDRWSRVEALYHAALEREAGERAPFLDAACGGDAQLRREVESLLAQPTDDGFLGVPAVAVAAQMISSPGDSILTGRRIGVYHIQALLGAGGMGEVYRARDTKLGRDVAFKILPRVFTADSDRLVRFEREARVLASLNHPHIGAIYGVEDSDGVHALVLELVEGETLADRLAKGALPLDQGLRLAIQIANALDTAHRAGIVHRDLKPGNIMLARSGGASAAPMAKLLDFGLAKASASAVAGADLSNLPTTPPSLTAPGTILGTCQYMAPEQLEGREADTRTDIFAFGAVLYEMLTGKKAFEGKSHASVSAAILEREPPPISALQPRTPRALDRLVRKCLAKDPGERWQSAKDLHDELTWVAAEGGTASSAMPAGAVTRGIRGRLAWKLLAAASLLGAIALAWPATLYFRRAAPEPVVTRLELVTPPTSDPFSFALSPDGRQIVFVASAEGGSTLWLRPLDQTTAQPLAGTDHATAPFWAPDGRAIGFFADDKLKRIDLTGAAPQVIADAPGGRHNGTWNRDGVIVFTAPQLSLIQVAAAGGIPTALTRVVQGTSHWAPQFLPDGRRFLFFAAGTQDTQGVYLGSLDGGEPTRVLATDTTARYAPPGYLLQVSQGVLVARRFAPGRAAVSGEPIPLAQSVEMSAVRNTGLGAFSVSDAGVLAYRSGTDYRPRRQLVWVDRAGRAQGVLGPPDDTGLTYVELSPDGRQVAVARGPQGNLDVWLIEVARGLARRFTFNPAIDSAPLWSPDGSRLVFRSRRNGPLDLFEKPADGTMDEQPLLVTPQDKAPQAWSPDGRFLLYAAQDPKTQSDLWALPLVGERTPFPVAQTSLDEVQGQFAPDGRWVAYASNESGRYEIYIRPFPGPGGTWQVSAGGGTFPRWRRDGQELFYVAPDNRMMAAPIHVSAESRTLSSGAPVALFLSRLTTGNTGVGGYQSRAQYAVAADGRFLLNVSADDATASPITIVQNWTAGLKK